jgi:methane/ammonia monooxygenase subunit C
MAATTVGGVGAADKPLLDVKWLTFAFVIYTVFYMWVRWYEGVYGWSAGLDSFAPEFETYWMNFLYTEIVLEVVTASILWGYIWKTRDRNLAAITPREELRRNMTHVIWLFAYANAIYWGASYFTEQDGNNLTQWPAAPAPSQANHLGGRCTVTTKVERGRSSHL